MDAIWTIGVMSGTSLDGVDVAYILTDGEWIEELGQGIMIPYPEELRTRLREAFGPKRSGLDQLEADLTTFYGDAISQLIKKHKIIPEVIGLHGQTLYHKPPETWQLGNGASLSERLKIPVVYDFRTPDVAAGGQGAPLVPIFHQALMLPIDEPMAVINIGGVANVTWMADEGRLIAGDTGPGIALMDDFIRSRLGQAYDPDGKLAGKGKVNEDYLFQWMSIPFYEQPFPKSLDRNAFARVLDDLYDMSTEDGLATLAALTARSIHHALLEMPELPEDIYLTGGGRHNLAIVNQLQDCFESSEVHLIDELGINGDLLEAYAFGFLATRVLEGLPTSFPSTTGVKAPLSGGTIVPVKEKKRRESYG